MPLLGFQSRFAPLVESGEKRQTIRAYRKDGRDPREGDRLYLWTGLRTKGARKLGESNCISARPLTLRFEHGAGMFGTMNGRRLAFDELEEIAMSDGFYGTEEMAEWFSSTHGLPFRGLLIEWGDLDQPNILRARVRGEGV